jgi:abortive infection bacteriophage resistance protein
MTRPHYAKPALSIDDQIDKLITEGMLVPDRDAARHALQHISYYRLSAYWLLFEIPKAQQAGQPRFLPGTSFDTVLTLYDFDRRLRLLALDAIERIEVAVRGSWAYELAMAGGAHGYLDPDLYNKVDQYYGNYSKLASTVSKSTDVFMVHYREKYNGPPMAPVWMVSEAMTFGQLSHWYATLKEPSLRNKIAKPFQLDEEIFVSFTHHVCVVRNICAHHSRLWNREFKITPKLPKKHPPRLTNALNKAVPKRIYNTLALIRFVLETIDPAASWGARLIELIDSLPAPHHAAMGFPQNWKTYDLWLESTP